MHQEKNEIVVGITILSIVAVLLISVLWGMSAMYKFYKVWSYAQDGKAELAKAEWEKKIAIETARSENEAATLRAESQIKLAKSGAAAEVERAKGVAESNKIIGDSLRGNDSYLRYLWITSLKDGNSERIYIPTEAGLPILEAKR